MVQLEIMKFSVLTAVLTLFVGVRCGDDGEELGSWFPQAQWRPPVAVVSQRYSYSRSNIPGNSHGQYRRHGQLMASGHQPTFLLQAKPQLPFCVTLSTSTYCETDNQYPSDFIASCIESDPELFRKLRRQVQWSCEVFPDEELIATDVTPLLPEEPAPEEAPPAEEELGPAEPEPLMVTSAPRRTNPPTRASRIQLERSKERLVKASPARYLAAPPVRRPAPIRRARDDTSGYQYSRQQQLPPPLTFNHTYEVCPSTIKQAVSVVRAEKELGGWDPLVQAGECRQVVRTEECLRAGEPCDYLCSHLKSQCKQRYSLQRLLTCSSDRGLHLEWFKIPTSCGCQVEMSPFLAQSTTPDPNADRR